MYHLVGSLMITPDHPIVSAESDNSRNTQGVDSNSILTVHNQERAEFGVTTLTWSNTHAADALTWADHLVTLQVIDGSNAHDPNPNSNTGENFGVRRHNVMNHATPDQMQQMWLREKNKHDGTLPPRSGHYGQMVSPVTTEVGCATTSTLGGPFAQSGGTDG